MPLTEKQQRFVEEYLIDLNASAAYKRAGYSAKGNAAETCAARLLRNVQVQAAISELRAEQSEKTGVTAEWVLTEAADMYREAKEAGDRKNALRALEMCGKHVAISAFKGDGAQVNVTVAPSLAHFYGQTEDDGG